MAKKRTSLDSLFEAGEEIPNPKLNSGLDKTGRPIRKTAEKTEIQPPARNAKKLRVIGGKSETVKQTVYLPPAVHDQLRRLAFEERKKMHDYLVEGLDRVFKNRGLKPYIELSGESVSQEI